METIVYTQTEPGFYDQVNENGQKPEDITVYPPNEATSKTLKFDERSDVLEFRHPGTDRSRPLPYNQDFKPENEFYIAKVVYSGDGSPGCAWCHPTEGSLGATVHNYGELLTIRRTCDGLACNFKFTVYSKKFFVDNKILSVSKDSEENLSSSIWGENKTGKSIHLVYEVQSYNPGQGKFETKRTGDTINAFSKKRLIPRYKRIDNMLYEEFLKPLYIK